MTNDVNARFRRSAAASMLARSSLRREHVKVEGEVAVALIPQYPSPERHGREHVLEEVCRRLAHSTPQAGWAEAAAFTRESDQMLLGARITLHPREAAAEQAAIEVAVELAPHERGKAALSKPAATAAYSVSTLSRTTA